MSLHFSKLREIKFLTIDNKENAVGGSQSRRIACCGVRTWALAIGWIQTILCGVSIVYFTRNIIIALSTAFVGKTQLDGNESQRLIKISVCVLGLLIICSSLVASIVLIRGVKQGNPRKLKAWILFEVALFLFVMLLTVQNVAVSGYYDDIFEAVTLLMIIAFFTWVVNLHRKEIMTSLAATVVKEEVHVNFGIGKFEIL